MGRCLGNGSLQGRRVGLFVPLAVGRPLILRPATVGSPSVGVPTTVGGVGGSKCCLLFLSIRDAPRTLKSPKKKSPSQARRRLHSLQRQPASLEFDLALSIKLPTNHTDHDWINGQHDE